MLPPRRTESLELETEERRDQINIDLTKNGLQMTLCQSKQARESNLILSTDEKSRREVVNDNGSF